MTEDNQTVLLGVTGSRAYGLDTDASDTDRIGAFVAPTQEVVGLGWTRHKETRSFKTKEGDHTEHEVGKLIRLALVCNPTVTEVLWLRDYEILDHWGRVLVGARRSFLSAKAVRDAYGGYARAQVERLQRRDGESFSSSTNNRTAKHARHIVRLLWQGEQLLRTGELDVRLTPAQRETCFYLGRMATRNVDGFVERFHRMDRAFRDVPTSLPDSPDKELANAVLLDIRRACWT